MPAFETMDLYGRALLWEFRRWNDAAEPVVAADPEEIAVRWVNKKYEVLNAKTQTQALDAQVVTDRFVPLESIIWHAPDPTVSALEQWNGTGSGSANARDDELMQVKVFNSSDDVKGRFLRTTLGCMRYGSNLPEQG
jgi:hypothetical protein